MCIEFVMRVSVFFDGLCLLQWSSVCRGHQSYGGLCRTGASGFLSPNLPPPALTPRPLKPSCSHTPRRTYSSPASDSQWRRHPSTWGRSDWLTNRQLAGVWALAIWKRKQSELKVFCSLIGQLTGTYQNAAGTVLFFIFLSAFIGLFVFYLNILVLKHVRWTFLVWFLVVHICISSPAIGSQCDAFTRGCRGVPSIRRTKTNEPRRLMSNTLLLCK